MANDSLDINIKQMKNKINKIKLIGIMLFVQSFIAFAVIFYLNMKQLLSIENDEQLNMILAYIVPIITIASIPLVFYLYNTMGKKYKLIQSQNKKLLRYRSIKMIQFGILEFAGFMSIIAFALTSNQQYIYLFLMTMVFLLAVLPSERKFIEDFNYEE